MAKNFAVGIDIGTYRVKIMVIENPKVERGSPRIIGTGFSDSRGLRHGYIINQSDIIRSIKNALRQAEKTSGVKIKDALLSVGGIGLGSVTTNASVVISRADLEITELDLEKAIDASRSEIPQSVALNRKIIHTIPISYKVDGKPVLGMDPIGMKGTRLEIKTLFIICLENHLDDLVQAVEEAGVEVLDVVASPLAASLVTLSKTQKIAGCVLANIGSETVSIVVFENNIPISLEIFPIGSNDITNDIALGLKTPLEEAERIKLGSITSSTYSKKKLEEIIAARLSDIFELIETHLKKIGRSGLLPAGIILTGGGSGIHLIEEVAKSSLNLPSKITPLQWGATTKETIKDAEWGVTYGLCLLGLHTETGNTFGVEMAKRAKSNIISWLKQFLP